MSPFTQTQSVQLISSNIVFQSTDSLTLPYSSLSNYQQQLIQLDTQSIEFSLIITCYICIDYTRDTGTTRHTIFSQLNHDSILYNIELYIDESDNCIYCLVSNNPSIPLKSNTSILYNTWFDIALQHTIHNSHSNITLLINDEIQSTIQLISLFQWSTCALVVGQQFNGIINKMTLNTTKSCQHDHTALQPSSTTVQPIPTRTLPIRSLKQLYNINDTINDPLNKSVIKYTPRSNSNRQRVIHCHDYKGGYTDDASSQPITNNSNTLQMYNFMHWNMIDIFIYFSHERVSIPTKSYIDQCHKHNVLCLGTFIVEWGAGTDEMMYLLTNQHLWEYCANQLIKLALYYGYDGYLINIESDIATTDDQSITDDYINRLQQWLDYLTRQIHHFIPNSMIIWYDSVSSITGRIKWQSELNEHNISFFKMCDAIFLDYKYTIDKIRHTSTAANQRNYDVYVGIDCYGRGTYGGGGYNTHHAMKLIRQYNLSVALFGAAWTLECISSGMRDTRLYYELADQKLWCSTDYIEHIITAYDTLLCSNEYQQQYDSTLGCYVSVASAQQCIRSVRYNIHTLVKQYNIPLDSSTKLCCLQRYCGTAPNYADPITWSITLIDTTTQRIIDQYNTEQLYATDQWNTLEYTFNISNMLSKCYDSFDLMWSVRCSDAEYWAGYHGTRLTDAVIIFTGMKCMSIRDYIDINNNIPSLESLLPFKYNFNTGIGRSMYINGVCVDNHAWYHLVQQNNQSISNMKCMNDTILYNTVECELTYNIAYDGGACIQYRITIDSDFHPIIQQYNILTYNTTSAVTCDTQYTLTYTVQHSKLMRLICNLYGRRNNTLNHTIPELVSTQHNWMTHQTMVTLPAGDCISSLRCTVLIDKQIINDPHCLVAYLGQITINDSTASITAAAVVQLSSTEIPCRLVSTQWQLCSALTGVDIYNAVIQWNTQGKNNSITPPSPSHMYDLYCDKQWIGRTCNTYFYIANYIDHQNIGEVLSRYYVVVCD